MTMISRMTTRIALTGLVIATGFAAQASSGDVEGKGGKMRHERPAFSALDTDSNGELTRAELEAHARARFDTRDTDGDGALSAEEMTKEGQKRAEKRAAKMIKRHDANDDGKVSFEEMSSGKKGNRTDKMLDRVDADKNGTISEEEYASMKKHRGGKHKGKKHSD